MLMHIRMAECPVLFLDHVTLTSDLVSRIGIESGAYMFIQYSLR